MNLIRNRGFELGNLDYWAITGGGSFAIDGLNQHDGQYCCALAILNGQTAYLLNQDYISVVTGQPIFAEILASGSDGNACNLYMIEYDNELNIVKEEAYMGGVMVGAYMAYTASVTPIGAAAYVRIGVKVENWGGDETLYIDTARVRPLSNMDTTKETLFIRSLSGITSSGSTSGTENRFDGFTTYYGEIDVTVFTGTAPTMDITICERDLSDNERVLATFAQIIAVGYETVPMTRPIGENLYLKWVEGGVVTDLTADVHIIGVK